MAATDRKQSFKLSGKSNTEQMAESRWSEVLRIISLILTVVSIALSSCYSDNSSNSTLDSVSEVFHAEEITGTFVAESIDGEISHFYNESRATTRFSPASTFKIPNTLIALNFGVVESKSSTFAWDGVDKGLERWNSNQTLETAFKVSCLWCYQYVARAIGFDNYESALAELDYGNQSVGERVDSFWINGSLEISAIEQVSFLRNLYNYDVPYQRKHVDLLRAIMVDQQTEQYTIYAKTGWAATEPQVAWYVGFVELEDGAWLFAMNMQVDRPEQAALRQELAIRSLRALGII